MTTPHFRIMYETPDGQGAFKDVPADKRLTDAIWDIAYQLGGDQGSHPGGYKGALYIPREEGTIPHYVQTEVNGRLQN